MKLLFRQGIVKGHVDSSNKPDYLVKQQNGNYISLFINESSVLVTIADNQYNYLYEEANSIAEAWGPFTTPLKPKYWLYWDINKYTGIRTFGYTTLQPIVSDVAPVNNEDEEQHWFDTTNRVMRVYDGYGWEEKLRVFAGEFENGNLNAYAFGSQVGINEEIYAGFILFDDEDKPVKRSNGSFLTTESQFYTTKSVIGTVSFDSNMFYASAVEHIPEYSVVSFYNDNQISLASYDDPEYKQANGLIRTQVYKSEVAGIVTNGYITNIAWNFNKPPTTPLYLGLSGTLQTAPPKSGFIQKVGTIVSKDTIYINIDPPIIYSINNEQLNNIPLTVDVTTGTLYTAMSSDSATVPSLPGELPIPTDKLAGFTYTQLHEAQKWTLTHNLDSPNVFVQCFNEQNQYVIPNTIKMEDNNNVVLTFAEPMKGTAQAVIFRDASYIIVPDVNKPSYEFIQTIPSAVWTINHDLGYIPITRVYVNNILVTPYSIIHTSANQVKITFVQNETGVVRFI